MTFSLFILIGGLFSSLAALSAFLITYMEYRRHFPDRKRALRAAAQTAVISFLFLFFLSLASYFLIIKIF
jgi:hypothetical protein